MKILYISSTVSTQTFKKLSQETNQNIYVAVQKFNHLIIRGLAQNEAIVETLSALPISRIITKKFWWNVSSEQEDGIYYRYVPFVNLPVLRHACLFMYSFFFTLLWGMCNRKDKCIMCDVLNISLCMGSLLASKLIGLKSMGVMTDMPGLMVNPKTNETQKGEDFVSRINKSFLTSFSCYVFLTEQMNDVVNLKHRPYIVMEGLVDAKMADEKLEIYNKKEGKQILVYAGGLHERYGLKMLVEAFMLLEQNNVELWLFGNGPFVEQLQDYCSQDDRIIYQGVVPNEKVVEAELLATLLVNPRPTNEEFTKYSFPSKNMEYMVSGTPVLTTCLPGMPIEYYPYVYLFDEETIEGYAQTLQNILSLSKEKLQYKGRMAKKFVLDYKNNVVQARRMIDLGYTNLN